MATWIKQSYKFVSVISRKKFKHKITGYKQKKRASLR